MPQRSAASCGENSSVLSSHLTFVRLVSFTSSPLRLGLYYLSPVRLDSECFEVCSLKILSGFNVILVFL